MSCPHRILSIIGVVVVGIIALLVQPSPRATPYLLAAICGVVLIALRAPRHSCESNDEPG